MYKGFSAGLLGFNNKSFEESLPLAEKYGYKGINLDVTGGLDKGAGYVKEQLSKHGLTSGGFGLPVDYRNSEEKFEDDLKRLPEYCKFAAEVGDFRCFTWIIPFSNNLDYKANFQMHKNRLGKAAKILEEYGIRLGIEFVGPPAERKGKKYEFIHDLDGLLELIDAIGTKNLGFLLDVWHWDMAGQSSEDFKKIQSRDQVVIVHINDAPASIPLEEQQDLSRELPGATGILKIEDFFKGLQGLDYDGPVYVEPFNEKLCAMNFEDAVKVAKLAMDKVWPK